MFERFTVRARRVIVAAQDEARTLHHDHIGPEHLLLGVLQEGEGVAVRALEALGISLEAVRTEHILLGLIRQGDGVAAQVLIGMGADLDRVRPQVIALVREHG